MIDLYENMDIGQIFNKAFLILKKQSSNFFRILLIFLSIISSSIIILGIFFYLILIFNQNILFEFKMNSFNSLKNYEYLPHNLFLLFFIIFLIIIIACLIFMILNIFFYGMTNDLFINAYINKNWNLIKSFKLIKQKFMALFTSVLLQLLISLISLFFIFACFTGLIALILFNIIFSFIYSCIIFENNTVIASFKRSFKLVKYDFWSILGVIFILNIILSTMSYLPTIIISILITISTTIPDLFKTDKILLIILITCINFILYFSISYISYGIKSCIITTVFFNQKIHFEKYNDGKEIIKNYHDL